MDALMFWMVVRASNGAWQQVTRATLADYFGQQKPESVGKQTRKIIAYLLRYGVDIPTVKIVKALGVKSRWVKRVRAAWREEIQTLISEASALGYSAFDLSLLIEFRRGAVFAEELRRYRERMGIEAYGLHAGEFQCAIEALWREYREAKAYAGHPPDNFEVHPPVWFVRRELGLDVEDGRLLVRTSHGWQVVGPLKTANNRGEE